MNAILELMKPVEGKSNSNLGRDLLKSFLLSVVAIAIVATMYYVWR